MPSSEWSCPLLSEKEMLDDPSACKDCFDQAERHGLKSHNPRKQILPWVSLTCSILLNILLLAVQIRTANPRPIHDDCLSPYAKLPYDRQIKRTGDTLYGPRGIENASMADKLWESYAAGPGQIALDTQMAQHEMNLPPARGFPWDISRTTYYIGGFHKLHCVKILRRAIVVTHRGGNPFNFEQVEHYLHCLDVLRQSVICEADDTPLAGASGPLTTGVGQMHRCRDWGKLEAWAKENSACYAYINETQGVENELLRYRYCPEGSIFRHNMLNHFNLSQEWVGDNEERIPDYTTGHLESK